MGKPAVQLVTVIVTEKFVVPATVRVVTARENEGRTRCLKIGAQHYQAAISWLRREVTGDGEISWVGDTETQEAVDAVTSLVHDLEQIYRIRPATVPEVKFFGTPRREDDPGCIVKVH